jgi:hypothetical protein
LIDGVLSIKEKNKQTIHTIEKWTDAFIVCLSIYTSAHPEKYQALLKYMHIVRLGASRINGLGWTIKVITKLPNSEQSYEGKVQTHNYINRQNQSTTGKL